MHAGLDESDKATHPCVVAGEGRVLCRGVFPTDPHVIGATLGNRRG
jgi:hypothetical protein